MESEVEIIRALHGGALDVARARAGADPAWARAIGAFAALYDLAPDDPAPTRAPDDPAPDDPAPDPASAAPGEGAGTAAAQRAFAEALL
ncbi:MAG: hypothetical protein CMN31_26225, partial [Sandaracinus sp.]|nr:hypothetical protein [Sandaracinus sp.]